MNYSKIHVMDMETKTTTQHGVPVVRGLVSQCV